MIELPSDFYYDENTKWLMRQGSDNNPAYRVCSWLQVEARTRDTTGSNYGYLLHWVDDDNRPKRWAMPAELLASDGSQYRRILLMKGLKISSTVKARQSLTYFIQRMGELVQKRVYSVPHIGWHQKSFVHPQLTFKPQFSKDEFVLQTMSATVGMSRQGSSQSWKNNIGKYCQHNSILNLGICAALASPLLRLCSSDGFGIHLTGDSSIGKTAALFPALSVWGRPSQLCNTWRSTANGLEGTALMFNDCLLALDEIGEIDPREIGSIAYMLANGEGKNRLKDSCETRRPPRWKLVFLSTGEVTLEHLMASVGKNIKAGQQVRVIDLQADAGLDMGIFEETYGMKPAEFADHLKRQSEGCYGFISYEWLNELVNRQSEVSPFCHEIRNRFHCDIPKHADGQVLRVANKFALLAAAGKLAIKWNILDWEANACFYACRKLFFKWLDGRGGANSGEELQAIERVRSFIQQYGTSRFITLKPTWNNVVQNCVGVIDNRHQYSTEDVYCFHGEGWREVLKGLDSKRAARALANAGYLISDTDKLQKKMKLPDGSRPRLYCVKKSILNEH
ncbi:DUF927 domain-containing protein [Parashewanella curva]|uniref:DUF927 domain-containing protein n=1 Tax=Parashewanella curva TaxID=2338552 RepID=A0A3L8PW71_9GAMM|nr:DUF927 domain-containing protein [Parashewanella curva]